MSKHRTADIVAADGTAVAIKRRIPWARVVVAVIVVYIVAWMLKTLLFNENIQWATVGEYLFNERIVSGIGVTIWISIAATVVGLVLGVLLAVMKLSVNPVLRWIAEAYIWFFRGTPVIVQLIFWFNLAFLLPHIIVKIPFTMVGVYWDTNELITGSTAAILGLGLNMAAYFAETVRAGIQAIDAGQSEAAQASGMTRGQTMRLIVLPQAMRIIIPPTANEFISMLKTTSLVMVVAGTDLMTNASQIYKVNNLVIELLIVVSIWYMLMTAIATYLQSLLENRFGRDRVRLVRKGSWMQRLFDTRSGTKPVTTLPDSATEAKENI
ncbi:amino acid ABC transporter permease [Brevibacterium sp. 91QC2O2]|uniref:amino acid ABC transporter permease n=1 Tax=Brevibacterium sp. 91QC2O2 TaxID=2968458 RepID=UPI00211B9045|nr:amino acid ABC transporter permease [Brevibacterium sp. 91QC2O2]MCQ9366658.1 amino acid ABC transporter permease [Brevibacterium sp. 91QC2O2]